MGERDRGYGGARQPELSCRAPTNPLDNQGGSAVGDRGPRDSSRLHVQVQVQVLVRGQRGQQGTRNRRIFGFAAALSTTSYGSVPHWGLRSVRPVIVNVARAFSGEKSPSRPSLIHGRAK